MKVLNTLIHEELGKVDVIFTDKTGTLTSNTMVFRHANVAGEDFSERELEERIQTIFGSGVCNQQENKEIY